jgi:hypothetical protein
MDVTKNPAKKAATFGAYPSLRIFPVIRVQKSGDIVYLSVDEMSI